MARWRWGESWGESVGSLDLFRFSASLLLPTLLSSPWGSHSCCAQRSTHRASGGPLHSMCRQPRGRAAGSPNRPEHLPPVTASAGRFKRGESLRLSFSMQCKCIVIVYQFLADKNRKIQNSVLFTVKRSPSLSSLRMAEGSGCGRGRGEARRRRKLLKKFF